MRVLATAGYDSMATARQRRSGAGEPTLSTPRAGAAGLCLEINDDIPGVLLPPVPENAQWIVFGAWINSTGRNGDCRMLSLETYGNCGVGVRNGGSLFAWDAANAEVDFGGVVMPQGSWCHIMAAVKPGDVAGGGWLKVWVNGALELNQASRTAWAGDWTVSQSTIKNVKALSGHKYWSAQVDDFWLAVSDTEPTEYLNLVVSTLKPSGAGVDTQWVASAGANWEAVSDDSGATYVQATSAGQRDLYEVPDLPGEATGVLAVSTYMRGLVDGVGSLGVAAAHRHTDGTVSRSAPAAFGSSESSAPVIVWNSNPATAAAWTVADVNGAQFGLELA